jgi:hypothetical protein
MDAVPIAVIALHFLKDNALPIQIAIWIEPPEMPSANNP